LVDLCLSAVKEALKEAVKNVESGEQPISSLPDRLLGMQHFDHAFAQVAPSTKTSNPDLEIWERSFAAKKVDIGGSAQERTFADSKKADSGRSAREYADSLYRNRSTLLQH
jgi:hypothetical protein